MSSLSQKEKAKNLCGIPKHSSTNHCFNDGTHHTCCMLGPKARKYADDSNNPIGKASEKIYKIKNGKDATDKDLTSWCTCFGSKVCSYYASKFNDGTHIKFINNPNKNQVLKNVSSNTACEEYARKSLEIKSHGTPGVYTTQGGETCSKDEIGKIKYESI